jgi:hypothetical protein
MSNHEEHEGHENLKDLIVEGQVIVELKSVVRRFVNFVIFVPFVVTVRQL